MKFTEIVYWVFILFFCKTNIVSAQKKNIDSNAYMHWSSVSGVHINDNGKYVYYTIENEPVGSSTFVLQSTENTWKRSYVGISGQCFLNTKKGDYAIALDQKYRLMIISLGKDMVQYISGVSSFNVDPNWESEWTTYQEKGSQGKLVLQNINTGKRHAYKNVINKILGYDGQTVILQAEKKINDQTVRELSWVNLNTGKSRLIIEGLNAKNIILDMRHNQLAFISEKGLFSFHMNDHRLNHLINYQRTHFDSGLRLGGIDRFSNDGNRLFIELTEKDKPKPKDGSVEVWSYLDQKIQSQQENEIGSRTYAAVINLKDGKMIRLENEYEHLASNPFKDGSPDTIRILYQDSKIRDGITSTRDLISLTSGKRTRLKYQPEGISPSGKYLIYLDPEIHNYVSYNTKTGVYHNISKAFSENFLKPDMNRARIARWLDNDESVLFYDTYDIWKFDLSGQKTPINLTAGYGRIHNFVFSLAFEQFHSYSLKENEKIILSAFDLNSKRNGFYSIDVDKSEDPKLLSIGDYIYYAPWMITVDVGGNIPIKAKNAETYIVSRMSAKESPNYFCTQDFKTFKALSNVYPERNYNWYTTELHKWTSPIGTNLQGILYKPENFDLTKRYPIIFNYYEDKSNNLNAYIRPEVLYGGGNIDISTYINNGYLIFTPDIVYKVGDPMQGTYDAIVSAAKYISTLPYVDSTKMGIQGFSWGGVQTNYLLTHTNLFAAACSASGIADWVSDYGGLYSNGNPLSVRYEWGQFRMGKDVWEIPNTYIKTSPIFKLDKVTTPFLIMHTKKDGVCSYEDALKFFTGLRRLGKRSWMLAYSEGNHGLLGKEAEDFATRMMQFFDHYLKDKPAPVWMTRGISAERRGLDDGLAYDREIKTPGPGLLTPSEQKTVDSLMTRKSILIELK